MNRYALKGLLAATTVLAVTSGANAHWDRPSCYIEVHYGCYVDTDHPCSDEDYQGFLENCDTAYPSVVVRPRPGGLKAPTSSSIGLTR